MNALHVLWQRLCHMGRLLRQGGVAHMARMVVQRVRGGPGSVRVDVFKHYDFVCVEAIHLAAQAARPDTLLWFIPDFNIGSGGHQTIFRTIWHLERMGWESGIVIVNPEVHASAAAARDDIVEHFFPLKAQVYVGFEGLPNSEFVIATGWQSAYPVRAVAGPVHKLYFVQDFEPAFYPTGTESVLAENTYHFGFFGITAGDWLAHKLHAEYGMQTHAISFGVDHELYCQRPRREPHVRRVFFYARPPTPRRAFEFGLLVLQAVARRLPHVQFVLAGWDASAYRIPFNHLSAGVITPQELADVFSQCDVALVMSLTNLSLMPLEAMAAGCAVVSNRGPCVQWLLNPEIACLTEPTVEALSEALCHLLTNDDERLALARRGQAFAKGQHWQASAAAFEQGLLRARGLQSPVPDEAVAR